MNKLLINLLTLAFMIGFSSSAVAEADHKEKTQTMEKKAEETDKEVSAKEDTGVIEGTGKAANSLFKFFKNPFKSEKEDEMKEEVDDQHEDETSDDDHEGNEE